MLIPLCVLWVKPRTAAPGLRSSCLSLLWGQMSTWKLVVWEAANPAKALISSTPRLSTPRLWAAPSTALTLTGTLMLVSHKMNYWNKKKTRISLPVPFVRGELMNVHFYVNQTHKRGNDVRRDGLCTNQWTDFKRTTCSCIQNTAYYGFFFFFFLQLQL